MPALQRIATVTAVTLALSAAAHAANDNRVVAPSSAQTTGVRTTGIQTTGAQATGVAVSTQRTTGTQMAGQGVNVSINGDAVNLDTEALDGESTTAVNDDAPVVSVTGTDPMMLDIPDYSSLVGTSVKAMTRWTSNLLSNIFANMGNDVGGGSSGSIYFPESHVMAVKCLRVNGIDDIVVDATLKQVPSAAGSSAILFSVVEMATADPASCGMRAPRLSTGEDPFLNLVNGLGR